MTRPSLCPPTTTITDFAYPENHPLRTQNFPTKSRGSFSSEDNEYSDDGQDEDGAAYGQPYSSDEINLRAVALFDFEPENANEVALKEGQVIWISYRHGQGWLVAEDPVTGENGLIPEEYVEIFYADVEDLPKPFMPQILEPYTAERHSEWEDTDDTRSDSGDEYTDAPSELAQLAAQMRNTALE